MKKIEVKILNPESIDQAEKLMVCAARLTQRGHQISCLDDFMDLYEKPYQRSTVANLVKLPHPTIQKFGIINVVVVGASRRFLAQITRHQNEVKYMSASLQYSDYSGVEDFVIPYDLMGTGQEEGYLRQCSMAMKNYQEMIRSGVDNDSAGYSAPQGMRNILLISATPYQWKHMIRQRTYCDSIIAYLLSRHNKNVLKMKVRNIFMEFLSLAKQRCSVRKYKTDEIEKEKLDKILEAARIAPTAANAQSQRLLVISSQEAKEKLSKGVNYHGAPLAIIVCGDHSDVFVRPFDKKDMVSVDATIVADHIVLEAEDLGLSSCWLTYFDPEIIRNEFNIPSNLEPIAIIAVGYADTEKASPDRHSKDRKALESLVCYETF